MDITYELVETKDGVEYIVKSGGNKVGIIEKPIQLSFFYFYPDTEMEKIQLKQDITGSKLMFEKIGNDLVKFVEQLTISFNKAT